MSIRPEFRKCKKCGKRYSYNPDVGQFMCTHCLGVPAENKKDLRIINNVISRLFDR